jgi:hypothetical protein
MIGFTSFLHFHLCQEFLDAFRQQPNLGDRRNRDGGWGRGEGSRPSQGKDDVLSVAMVGLNALRQKLGAVGEFNGEVTSALDTL